MSFPNRDTNVQIITQTITVNGQRRSVTAPADMPLLWVLRDKLGLTGVRYGCGVGVCRACTILIGDDAFTACTFPFAAMGEQPVTTVEGLSDDGNHPLQQAWLAESVPQCGYCQAGMLMAAEALLRRDPEPDDTAIDDAMPNICRCGTYPRVRKAIRRAGGSTPA